MEPIIRKAVPKDAPDLARIATGDLGYNTNAVQVRENLLRLKGNPAHITFVAEVDGVVQGFVQLSLYDPIYTEPRVNVMGIAVSASCRGLGLGKKLMEAAENWTLSQGRKRLRLTSNVNREAAHKFYESCGYATNKTSRNFTKEL